jgi:hypothetical protein
LAAGVAAACGGDDGDGPTGLDPNVFELAVVSGGNQTGLAGTVLDEPMVVRVRRKDTGAPEEGATVQWRVISGSGATTRSASGTDESGEASTLVALGDVAGEVVVEASVLGLVPVTLAPVTVLPAPSIRSVTPASVDPGDTIDVVVDDLPAGMSAVVLFDGVEADIAERQDGTPSSLRAVVPPPAGVCSAQGVSVDVRLRVDGVTTSGSPITVSVPADPFQVGQVLVIEGTNDVQCALLPTDNGNAKYLLVALSAQFEQTGSFRVTLGSSNVTFAASDAAPSIEQANFHSRLRAYEHRLASRGLAPATPPSSTTEFEMFAGPSLGDTRQFWALNDIDATSDDELTEDEFDRITATLEFIGANTLLYIDDRAPFAGLTPEDIEFLGETYDRRLYDVAVDYFGEPTDVDANDKVVILLTPTVNSLTVPGSPGVVIGFFFGLDLFPPSASGCDECRYSNGSELFYGVVPDPNGDFSDPRTREFVNRVLPGVMVHETVHMIDFRYQVFENVPASLENLWLSEGIAHASEELAGDVVFVEGDQDLADKLYGRNFGRAAIYLEAPQDFSLTATEGSGSLGERGAWWLFFRWTAEQYGDFLFRGLTQANANGVRNVEGQTGEDFFRLFADYSVAIWADDMGIPGLPERYEIPKWMLRSILTEDGDPTSPYLLQPLQQTFASFRSNQISEFITGSSAFYVELDAAGDLSDLQLELTASTDAGLAILRYE